MVDGARSLETAAPLQRVKEQVYVTERKIQTTTSDKIRDWGNVLPIMKLMITIEGTRVY